MVSVGADRELVRPADTEGVAAVVREAARCGRTVCVRGAATKACWGGRLSTVDVELDTLTATAVTEVYGGKTAPRDALAFAQREAQRRLDEFWAGVKA